MRTEEIAPSVQDLCVLLAALRGARDRSRSLGLTEVTRQISLAIHGAEEVLDARTED